MRKLQLTMVIFGIVVFAAAGEEWSNDIYNYEAQIDLGSGWEVVPIASSRISPQKPPEHFWGIYVLGSDRMVFWTGHTPNSTLEEPEVIQIGIEMPRMPTWWGECRARFRPFPIGIWSEPSQWIRIIDLSVLPKISAFSATPEGE